MTVRHQGNTNHEKADRPRPVTIIDGGSAARLRVPDRRAARPERPFSRGFPPENATQSGREAARRTARSRWDRPRKSRRLSLLFHNQRSCIETVRYRFKA